MTHLVPKIPNFKKYWAVLAWLQEESSYRAAWRVRLGRGTKLVLLERGCSYWGQKLYFRQNYIEDHRSDANVQGLDLLASEFEWNLELQWTQFWNMLPDKVRSWWLGKTKLISFPSLLDIFLSIGAIAFAVISFFFDVRMRYQPNSVKAYAKIFVELKSSWKSIL